MRFLLSISVCLSLLACAKPPYGHLQASPKGFETLSALRPDFSTTVYQAHIDVANKHLSGLLIFKNLPDSTARVVFTNEMGVKFFDFEYNGEQGFKVLYCIPQLNKKVVVNQLRKDFEFILMKGFNLSDGKAYTSEVELFFHYKKGKENLYYVTDSQGERLLRAENASSRKKKVIITFAQPKNGMAETILIEHQLFNFRILLNQIERNAEGN